MEIIMSVTGVVLNYNNYEETIECVNSLLLLNVFEYLIIVDNASTDKSQLKFDENYTNNKKVIILKSKINGGYAAGNNLGIKYANEILLSDYTLICNPDVRIDSATVILKLTEALNENHKIVAAAPKMLNIQGDKIINAWKIPTYLDDLILSSVILTKIFGNRTVYSKDYIESSEIVEVQVLSGSCFLINTKFIADIGYLDEKTFLYGEERILAREIKNLDLKQVLINDIYFHHFHGTTISKNIKTYIKRFKILSDSRYYFQTRYNNINFVKKMIFKLFIWIGTFEQVLFQIFIDLKNRLFV